MLSTVEKVQFRVLFRQFLFRVVDLELLAPEGDLAKLLGHFASLLVFFSVIMALVALFTGNPPPGPAGTAQSWTMEHFLISTTMLVVGLFAVLSWDSSFPDRRDMLVLAPLPIRVQTLLLAKVAAVAAALGATVLALNIFSGISWPLFWIPPNGDAIGFLRALVAYWATTFAAGVFIFGSVLALQGVAAQLLSRRMFLRASALLQITAFSLFICMYFLEPHWAYPKAMTAEENQALLAWLPSYWFLALFQMLNGSMPPALLRLAERAIIGVFAATVGATVAFLLCYFRNLRKIIEEPDIAPARKAFTWPFKLGNATSTAISNFSIRTLLRSRQHRAIVCFYLGVGFAVVFLFLKSGIERKTIHDLGAVNSGQAGVPLLASSIIMICAAVLGIRVAFSMPADVRANWIFRIIPLPRPSDCLIGARRGLLILAGVPIWVGSAALLLSMWPLRMAMLHLGVLALLGVALTEASMLSFRKIPFTCSYLPGKANVYLAFWTYTMLGVPVLDLCTRVEWRALHSVRSSVAIMVILAVIAATLEWWSSFLSKSREAELKFEESPEPAVFALDLHRDGELIDTVKQ